MPAPLTLADTVFTGFNGRVAALDKRTGEIVWSWRADADGYVTLLLDGHVLVVAVNGYMYGLNARTGDPLWSNKMPGFGFGVTSLTSQAGTAQNLRAAAEESEQHAHG